MKNYYEELGLSPSMSLGDIQDELVRQRRKLANKTNSSNEDKRREAESKIRDLDDALDTVFSDEASRQAYDKQLSQDKETSGSDSGKERSVGSNRKRIEEKEEEVHRQREAEEQRRREREQEQARIAAKRRRKGRAIRFIIFLLILGGAGYFYYTRHIQPVQELYDTADACLESGDYEAACFDYFEVNDAWFSRFLFRDAYTKGYDACTLWLGREPVLATGEENPWWELDENGDLSFEEDALPEGAALELPTILDGTLVTGIADYGFSGCDLLGTVEVPANYRRIGEDAFSDCENLSSVILNGAEEIGKDAFSSCGNLTAVTLSDSIRSIGAYAFYCCDYLTNITLNEGLGSIGEYAFYGCGTLQNVTIPGTVESIGEDAFGDSGVSALLFAEGAAYTVIGADAFADCDNLTQVTLSANVKEIGPGAFKSCDYLSGVSIGDGCISIGDRAFADNRQLTWLAIGQSVQAIGEGAFAGSGIYGELTLPAALVSVGASAFEDCNSITKVSTAEGTNGLVIHDSAFRGCDYLQGAYLPGVTQLGGTAFENCGSMYWVVFDDSLSSLGNWCFSHANLSSVSLGTGLTAIGEGAFYDNDALEGLEVPAGVGIIEASTFSDCESLRWLYLHENITIIRDDAVYAAPSLYDIYYSGDEVAWSNIAIGNNEQLNVCAYHFNYVYEG